MSKILSQEEIDALMTTTPDGDPDTRFSDPLSGGVITYNFRRPDRISKEQIRSLHFLHDRFARNVTTSLAAYLRALTEFSIVSVEQFSYSEFLMSLSDPTAYYAISMPPLDGIAALELNPTLAFTIIDRMLGGSGRGTPPQRALTEIEQNVIDSVVKLILENLTETWRAVFDLEFRIHARETRPQMLQVAGPNEVVILMVFDLRVGDVRGMLNLCIPASVIEATGSAFVQGWHRTQREPTATERSWLHDNLNRVPLDVSATLDTRLRARDLVMLKRGDVLSLGVPIHTPVIVRVGNRAKFKGRLIAPDLNVGVMVESLMDADHPATELVEMAFTSEEWIKRFVDDLASVIGAIGGGVATTAPGTEAPANGWVVTLRADLASRGELVVEFDRVGSQALAKSVMGMDTEPADEMVVDTLKELCAQAVDSMVLEPPLVGSTLAIVSVDAIVSVGAASSPASSSVLAQINVDGSPALALRLSGDVELVDTPPVPALSASVAAAPSRPAATPKLDVILDIDLPLTIRFGHTEMPLRMIAALGPGSVIDLGRSPDDPVDVLVSHQLVARGEVVIVGGNYGVRITDVIGATPGVRSLEDGL